MSNPCTSTREWLEADGLGGFASGTSTGVRTRRYHALLLTAMTPPTGRIVLVNGFDAWVETAQGNFSISSHCYSPNVMGGDGWQRIESFESEPWPRWVYRLEDGTRIEFEVFAVKGQPTTCLSWKLLSPSQEVMLRVRPFFSGRDSHSLHKANAAFQFDARVEPGRVSWQPYQGVPGVTALTNGAYSHEPHWYYNFLYEEERARGLDCEEDLAAPGVFSWNLGQKHAALVLTTTPHAVAAFPTWPEPVERLHGLRHAEEKRRNQFESRLHAAADAYIVQRDNGKTIIAGYPWFTDWGRDPLIALRGLCLATRRLDVARDTLLAWSSTVSLGMLPNRFPDQGGQPEFNAVDASLWFIIAVHEFLEAARQDRLPLNGDRQKLLAAVDAILDGYSKGTRFGIRVDRDGLLAAGERGVQLTWMDAKVGEWVVTPRVGKPVEVQALWLNALWIGSQTNDQWKEPFELGRAAFRARFWNEERRCLYDVVDVNHRPGEVDGTLRPNQILAVGGLPLVLLDAERARFVVEVVEHSLLTPMGLRSLGPDESGYVHRYEGGVSQRDGRYHQGTAWPWLLGPFVEAWVRVRAGDPAAKAEARRRFLEPLLRHLDEAGLGHVSEIADADSPHTPRGCPFQAWSVGEALRLDLVVLKAPSQTLPLRRSFPKTRPANRARQLAPA